MEKGGRENIFEVDAEKTLRELARDYWLKLHLSPSDKVLSAEIEAAQEVYTRYLDRLENFSMLPRQRVTEIIREVREEARQEAEGLIEVKNKLKISELN